MGKRKCAEVGPNHAWDSQGNVRKTNKTGDCVSRGLKCNQGRNNSTGTTQGADGRKPNAKEYCRGRKRNGRRDRYNVSTNSRAAERCREGEYGMVSADGGRENVWASSDNAGVLENH